MKIKTFKIRASAIGQIMGVRGLGKTGETYCENWLKEQIYDRKKEFSNKYTDKGVTVEDNGIDFIAEQLNYGILIKNEKHYENDFLTGTPDVVLKELVIDDKNSWDCFTFPLFAAEIPNKGYWWQLQGYMVLTDTNHAKLVYTLLDTPVHIIDKEFQWNNKLDLKYEEFTKNYKYEHIPAKYRIKVFEFERDNEAIQQTRDRVEECRKYINQLL